MKKIKFKKLYKNAIIPKKSFKSDSGYDLYSLNDIELRPLVPTLIKTGISVELPSGYDAQIRPRSGLAIKHGLSIVNSPGTIDNEYRGEIKIIAILLVAPSLNGKLTLKAGSRVAQLVISKVINLETEIVDELSNTSRSTDGFGSTGI